MAVGRDGATANGRGRGRARGRASDDGAAAGEAAATAPLSLRERNRLRTRQTLLEAALEVFAERGFGSATVEAIAARAGASKVTLYSYFPNGREELFREIYDGINSALLERAGQLRESRSGAVARVVALAEALIEVAARPKIGRLYSIEDPALEAALDPVRGHASAAYVRWIRVEIEQARTEGRVGGMVDSADLAELLVGAMRAALSGTAKEAGRASGMLRAFETLVSGVVA